MKRDLEEIYRAFDGKLVGTKKMQHFVCSVLSHMPDKIINFITKNCWFITSMEDAWAFTFTGNDLKNQHLIFLSDELFKQHASQVRYSIAHEIGHVVLKHRNSTLVKQSKEEIDIQETEADIFAKQFTGYS